MVSGHTNVVTDNRDQVENIEQQAKLVTDTDAPAPFAERYSLIARIGEGGMSEVYKARHLFMNKTVAVKLLKSHFSHDPDSIKRFQQEAKAACELRHSNIVPVTDFGLTADSVPFLVMDFAEGTTLADIMKHGPLPMARAHPLLKQIASALDYAHSHGVVHRDLKPSNLIVTRQADGSELVQLLDFGIAHMEHPDEEQHITKTGEVFGTPVYMSPEQFQGLPVDSRSDIYSFGCLIYEMLVGQPPFTASSSLELAHKHINEQPVAPTKANPSLHLLPGAEKAILKCLSKNGDDRYRRAGKAVDALLPSLSPLQMVTIVGVTGFIAVVAVAIISLLLALQVYHTQHNQPVSVAPPAPAPAVEPAKPDSKSSSSDKHSYRLSKGSDLYSMPPDTTDLSLKGNYAITDDSLVSLSTNRTLEDITVEHTQIGDKGLAFISKIPTLKELHLGRTQVTEAGLLSALRTMPQLKLLSISGLPMTDSGIKEMPRLKKLYRFTLKDTKVGDGAMQEMGKFKALKKLDLVGTNVTDEGLIALGRVTKLEKLHVSLGGGLTMRGIEAFKKAQPNCKVDDGSDNPL